MINYENKHFTLGELAKLNDTTDVLTEWQKATDFDVKNRPEIVSNGRHNHITIGCLMPKLTHNFFLTGGQGNSDPDMFHIPESVLEEYEELQSFLIESKADSRKRHYKEKKRRFLELSQSKVRIEDKAFRKGERFAWVAKSTYFGNNSGAQKLKAALPELTTEQLSKDWIMERNYGDDDYYCLTSTSAWDGNLFETEIFIVKTESLIDCLSYDYSSSKPFCYVDVEKVRAICTPLIDKKKVA